MKVTRLARNALPAFVVLGHLLFVATSADAQAQKGERLTIAVVDMQRVLREAKAANDVRTALDEQRKKFEASLEKTRAELKDAQEKLKAQQTILTPAALQQRRHELELRFSEIRRQTEEKRAQLTQVFNKAMLRVRQQINKAVAELMDAKGASIAIPRSAVLVFDDKLEITDDVVASVNKSLPKFKFRFETKPKGEPGQGQKPQKTQ